MEKKVNHELAKEILEMVEKDQKMRNQWATGKHEWDEQMDKRNTKRLKEIVRKYGWPIISLVGEQASSGAWVLIQHADHDIGFQKDILQIMEEIYKKDRSEISPHDIAYLTDRILTHQNKPQIFGTQFQKSKKGGFEPLPIKNRKNIDARRKEFGLDSLVDNTKRINQTYKDFKY